MVEDDFEIYAIAQKDFDRARQPRFKVGQEILLACTVDSEIEGLPEFEGTMIAYVASVHAYHDKVEYCLATINDDGSFTGDNVPIDESEVFADQWDYESRKGKPPVVAEAVAKPKDRSHLRVVK